MKNRRSLLPVTLSLIVFLMICLMIGCIDNATRRFRLRDLANGAILIENLDKDLKVGDTVNNYNSTQTSLYVIVDTL